MQRQIPQSGFTLVELITVIVILGFVSVMVLPRFLQPDSFQARTVQDKLISAARMAQQLAMSKAVSANVQLSTDNSHHRIRISYSEGGSQIIDSDIPAAVSISNWSGSYNKHGDLVGAAASISINGGEHIVRIELSGYAHAL
jgi:MSHA pilin protein MshC